MMVQLGSILLLWEEWIFLQVLVFKIFKFCRIVWFLKTGIKVASFFSAILTGSPVLLLDLEVQTTFGQIEEVDVEVVIVHLDRLVADLDLTIFPKLKHVYFIGSSNFKVETSVPSVHIESK